MSVKRVDRGGDVSAANGFVGREAELDRIVTLLLRSVPLVTLIGPGGVGKTRLAAEVVGRYQRARHVTVRWVRLARLVKGADVAAVEEEMAQRVVDTDFSGRSAWDALVDSVTETDAVGRTVQTVLVVDNCEHVIDSAGVVIARLLESVPGLSILATSREAIGWVDEQLVEVPPLSRQQAVALFRQRSELTGHPVADNDQIATATKICRHIHNHPLYIRLAAARLIHQPLAVILEELSGEETGDKRMRWSHGPRVGAESRHRGVSDVIAWSYDLCQDKERLLLDRMSVFAAGYDTSPEDKNDNRALVGVDLEAIEVVCCDDERPDGDRKHDGGVSVRLARGEIEGLLERLVDQSLVSAHITSTTTRYFLLESLRIFAARRLRERTAGEVDEPARLAARHRRYYRDKVVYAAANWFGPAEQEFLYWARAAWDNILTAVEGSITTPGDSALGLEICVGLLALRLPFFKGSIRETRRSTERALAATHALTPQPTELQVQAMAWTIFVVLSQGLLEDAESILEECVCAILPDPDSRVHWRQTLESDIGLPVHVDMAHGLVLAARGDAEAITVLTRARDKFYRLGDTGAAVTTETFAAMAAGLSGTAHQAYELTQHCMDSLDASAASMAKSWAQLALAITLTKHGNPTEALHVGRDALTHQLRTRDQWSAIQSVQIRTWSLAQLITDSIEAGHADRNELVALATEIARLAGGSATLGARLGIEIKGGPPFAVESGKAVAVAREVLGRRAYAEAENQGLLLRPELDEVQRFAMGTLSIDERYAQRPTGKAALVKWHELTGAEQEVATLAAARWTNSAIAVRRGNSVRTVDAHMAAILQKLMITSREEIIRFVPQDRQNQVQAEAARRPRRRNEQPYQQHTKR
ncbi:ATP-binding protein [Nocardia sp. CWNU-33]|uniref:ATP-binding protein n=1 Tax=Nocardia sp. CWNU-33 TaxID=3392117 RepID=UPI00398F40C3